MRALPTVWGWTRAPALSPAGLLARAALLGLFHGGCRVLGWVDCLAVFSLSPPPGWSRDAATAAAMTFLFSWFLLVFVAPVLVLAAGGLAHHGRRSPPGIRADPAEVGESDPQAQGRANGRPS